MHAKRSTAMAERHRVILITKGDLLDQERKLAQSGLGDLFHAVEIVSDKTPAVYARLFARTARGAASGDDGRQLAEIRRAASHRGRRLGRACAPWPRPGRWIMPRHPMGHTRFHALRDLGGLAALVDSLAR